MSRLWSKNSSETFCRGSVFMRSIAFDTTDAYGCKGGCCCGKERIVRCCVQEKSRCFCSKSSKSIAQDMFFSMFSHSRRIVILIVYLVNDAGEYLYKEDTNGGGNI